MSQPLPAIPPAVTVRATYGAIPWPHPEEITVEVPTALASELMVRDLVVLLAQLPHLAQPQPPVLDPALYTGGPPDGVYP